jgi:hypothetical protein
MIYCIFDRVGRSLGACFVCTCHGRAARRLLWSKGAPTAAKTAATVVVSIWKWTGNRRRIRRERHAFTAVSIWKWTGNRRRIRRERHAFLTF